jgi:hypothetical protein
LSSNQYPAGIVPDPALLKRLAISDSGFVFDPMTGHSFMLSESAVAILRLLIELGDIEQVHDEVLAQYNVAPEDLARDIQEFLASFRQKLAYE